MKDKIVSLVTKNKILLIVAIIFLVFGIIVGRMKKPNMMNTPIKLLT